MCAGGNCFNDVIFLTADASTDEYSLVILTENVSSVLAETASMTVFLTADASTDE